MSKKKKHHSFEDGFDTTNELNVCLKRIIMKGIAVMETEKHIKKKELQRIKEIRQSCKVLLEYDRWD